MRILFGWFGWWPRYEHTTEEVSTAFYHRRLALWFVMLQWSHNGHPQRSLEDMLYEAFKGE